MYALAIYCLATLVAAFAPSWQFLFWWRVIASFGTGGESAIIAPFLAEFVQRKYRGRSSAASPVLLLRLRLRSAARYLVVPRSADGMADRPDRHALPILMLLWWRRSLPESPRWLIQRGDRPRRRRRWRIEAR